MNLTNLKLTKKYEILESNVYSDNILSNLNCNILFTAPNADFGSAKIIDLIKEFCAKNVKRTLYLLPLILLSLCLSPPSQWEIALHDYVGTQPSKF